MPTLAPTIDGYALWHRLNEQGGYTIDPDTGEIPTSGYAVSLPGFERRYAPGTLRPGDVVTGLQDARLAARIYPELHAYAGAWRDDDTGSLYLDTSVVVADSATAERLASEWGQLAYFDLQARTSVYVAAPAAA